MEQQADACERENQYGRGKAEQCGLWVCLDIQYMPLILGVRETQGMFVYGGKRTPIEGAVLELAAFPVD